MSQDWFQDVLDFHRDVGSSIGKLPHIPGKDVLTRRDTLEDEELRELRAAVEESNVPEVADAIADLIYVLIGRAVSFGIDLRPVWDEVQRANMAKAGGPVREDGKRLKPEGWQPPDIAGVLKRQKPLKE